jgi:hypothetical protein
MKPFSAWFPRSPESLARSRWLVPLLFGAWSLSLGVDANWDLRNYHLYGPFAFLHGKLAIDLAPAGLQSYFNPLLDIPYYVAIRALPAPLVAFAMGAIQGLNFVLLLSIARRVLSGVPEADRIRVPLAVSLAGVLTANFLSEVGNTMGDNVTALFVIGALRVAVGAWDGLVAGGRNALGRAALAGVIMGLAFGLKLTNGIYAVALFASLLFAPGRATSRARMALVFGVAVLAGFCITGGFWMHEMWARFANPVFPQFSEWFPNALTRNVGIADDKWLPKGFLATLAWPFLFSLDSHRVGQVTIHQAIWPIVYVLFAAWAAIRISAIARGQATAAVDGPARMILAFVAVSYLVWIRMFGIARYLIPAEVLAPLACYILLTALLGNGRGRIAAAWLVGVSSLLVLAGGVHTWGHEGLSLRAFRVDSPQIARPLDTAVVLVGDDPPWAWLIPFFPPAVSFAQVGGNFPEGRGYRARLDQILRARPAHFAILPGGQDFRGEQEKGQAVLSAYGLAVDAPSCRSYGARIGRGNSVYQWCALRDRGKPPSFSPDR